VEDRLRLFAVAVAATRLNSNYKQTRRRDGSIIFRKRKSAESLAGDGPMEFHVAAVALVARTEIEAKTQALLVARQIMPDLERWVNHHCYVTEIADIQTFQKGFG
jgi:hypothetical protein